MVVCKSDWVVWYRAGKTSAGQFWKAGSWKRFPCEGTLFGTGLDKRVCKGSTENECWYFTVNRQIGPWKAQNSFDSDTKSNI